MQPDDDHDHIIDPSVEAVKEAMEGLYVCKGCMKKLDSGNIPSLSIINNNFPGACPPEVKTLNCFEEYFIRKVKCFMTVYKPGPVSRKLPPSERNSALKGRSILLPVALQSSLNVLTGQELINESSDDEKKVIIYGQPNVKAKTIWRKTVSRNKVYKALKWLKSNNPNYSDVNLPESVHDFLPHIFSDDNQDDDHLDTEESLFSAQYCKGCNESFKTIKEKLVHENSCKIINDKNDNLSNASQSSQSESDSESMSSDISDLLGSQLSQLSFSQDAEMASIAGSQSEQILSDNDDMDVETNEPNAQL